jgi:hypothetical protein
MESADPIRMKSTASRRQVLVLCLAIFAGFAMWGFVFPRLAARPAMQDKLERLQERGIDPGAMFYSDHPASFQD